VSESESYSDINEEEIN